MQHTHKHHGTGRGTVILRIHGTYRNGISSNTDAGEIFQEFMEPDLEEMGLKTPREDRSRRSIDDSFRRPRRSSHQIN